MSQGAGRVDQAIRAMIGRHDWRRQFSSEEVIVAAFGQAPLDRSKSAFRPAGDASDRGAGARACCFPSRFPRPRRSDAGWPGGS